METYGTTWCERCGQRAAVAEIAGPDGAARLCAPCAAQWEAAQGAWTEGAGGLVAGLAKRGEREAMLCPRCGFDLEDVVRRGRVGCPECYGAFEAQVSQLLAQSMPHPNHTGKWPKRWHNGRGPSPFAPGGEDSRP